ncbi:hypothetical protein DQ238_05955 [Geodermatophilus sp. TF02-6]|uniref:hypothetical protein n=1 Tax=Geodermatophilus sp. TF02-6 TaxID=2250575 RepID=UPI000DE97E7E|nr:hypothetical protein [Geodermatophilus sp. TF02-6]RBY82133.1 hypothetical protein DQ238_05955 [Geodermatophilus sp. TF02-6]
MSENDPDPHLPDEGQDRLELGGRPAPDAGDPTQGGRTGQIGDAPSITSDEPDDGSSYPVGGGRVTEEENASPVADPGPDS